jgi:hypothetical protein
MSEESFIANKEWLSRERACNKYDTYDNNFGLNLISAGRI